MLAAAELLTADEVEFLVATRIRLDEIETRVRFLNRRAPLDAFGQGMTTQALSSAADAVFTALNVAHSHGRCVNAMAYFDSRGVA